MTTQFAFDFGREHVAANDPIYGSPLYEKAFRAVRSFGSLSGKRQWHLVMQRDRRSCQACGKRWHRRFCRLEMDHIIPLEAGGEDSLSNCRMLCPQCHDMKTAMDALRYGWEGYGFRDFA